jgi:succinate dehydrogenase / fumarate reductase, cytochrome b subunit
MGWLSRFLKSNMGMKVIMALSGLVLVGFVVMHSLGNLQIFVGKETLNNYGEMLQGNKEVLWILRSGLILAVVAHIVSAVILTKRSRAARPVAYKVHKRVSESYSARTMRWGGLIVLAFIVFHILHMTTGAVHPSFRHCATVNDDFSCYVYENMVAGFEGKWGVVAFYVTAQIAIAMHLAHGVWSMCRSLGMNNPRSDAMARKAAIAIATVVGFINCFIPIVVAAGLVSADGLL